MTKEIVRLIIQIQLEDASPEKEYQVLRRSGAGGIPCPWFERPLQGSFHFFLDDRDEDIGVRLRCSSGGIDERQRVA